MAAMRLAIAGVCLAPMLVTSSAGFAREPGIGPSIPPGVSLGQANAVPLTPGVRVASRSSYEDANVLDNNSQATGLRNEVANETVLVTWIPGFDLRLCPKLDLRRQRLVEPQLSFQVSANQSPRSLRLLRLG